MKSIISRQFPLERKRIQTIRLIVNLKKRNRYVTSRHFKTDKLKTVFTMVRESCAMASIDLIVA